MPTEALYPSLVGLGASHTCALGQDAVLRCWGKNDSGQCDVPNDLENIQGLSAGAAHTCAIVDGGSVRCWGSNGDGQPNIPSGLTDVVALSAGTKHTSGGGELLGF